MVLTKEADDFKDQLCMTCQNKEDQSPPYTNNLHLRHSQHQNVAPRIPVLQVNRPQTKQEFDKHLCSANLEIERQKGERVKKQSRLWEQDILLATTR